MIKKKIFTPGREGWKKKYFKREGGGCVLLLQSKKILIFTSLPGTDMVHNTVAVQKTFPHVHLFLGLYSKQLIYI